MAGKGRPAGDPRSRGGPAIEAGLLRGASVPRPRGRGPMPVAPRRPVRGPPVSSPARSRRNRCLGLWRHVPEGPERRGPRLVAPPASPW